MQNMKNLTKTSDSALVVVDVEAAEASEAVSGIASVLETIARSGEQDEDAILGGYPVFFVCSKSVRKSFEIYKDNEFTFVHAGGDSCFNAENQAGQSLGELLDMLEIKTVFLAGIGSESCLKATAEELSKEGYKVEAI